uniref:Sodium/glucose cotransporter 4-like n=1 Tax=Saccoglossus kowalevskii TaxID=10224 RepID=A0ABM0MQR8_SACKO|nr:PREDICTED: sodium/glucose cotransporter 4-like [Saccoglossus kowalevskii]
MLETAKLATWDIVVIVFYFVFVLAVGLWATVKSMRGTMQGYFLAGRAMLWWPVGASLFASNIGSEHFIGLAGTGAASGVAVGAYEFNAMFLLLMLGWVFLPVYMASGVNMYAGALFINLALGWNMYLAIVTLLLITAVYTVLGGLTAVIYTDAAQTLIMLVGAFVLMVLAFIEVPYKELQVAYFDAIPNSTLYGNTTCGVPNSDAFHIFRDPVTSDLPWPGMIFGISISSLWYWCTDQSVSLPIMHLVFGCTNIAYPSLVLDIMPVGLRGLMLAVMMSALMSSLTSIFNSSSTIFTVDIYKRIRKKASERELLIVGRLFVIFMVVVSILWMPIIQAAQGGRLFDYIQSITSYLAPPICAIYVLAVAWWRINEKGAFWGLMIGLAIGMTRLVLDFVYPGPACGEEDTRPSIVGDVHFLYFGIILFVIVLICTTVISLLTKPIDRNRLHRLTFDTRFSRAERDDQSLSEFAVEEKDNNTMEIEEPESKRTASDMCWDLMCGTTQKQTAEERKEQEKRNTDIRETKRNKIIVNVNAILLMAVSIFLWGFYY